LGGGGGSDNIALLVIREGIIYLSILSSLMVLQLLLEAGRGSNRFAHLIFGLAHSLQGVDLSSQLVLELNDLRGLVHLKDLVLCCRQAGQIQGTLLSIPLHSSCSCGSHQLQKERKNDWFELCPFLGGRGGGRERLLPYL